MCLGFEFYIRRQIVCGLSQVNTWFLSLPREVFLRVLWFSSLLKTNISKFQFDQESVPNYCSALNTLTLKIKRFINLWVRAGVKGMVFKQFHVLTLRAEALLAGYHVLG